MKREINLSTEEFIKEYDENLSSLIPQMTNLFANKLAEFHDKIVMEELKNRGIKFDLNEQSKKKFQDFIWVEEPKGRSFYYNDGTEEGLRIVTFRTDFIDDENGRPKAVVNYF